MYDNLALEAAGDLGNSFPAVIVAEFRLQSTRERMGGEEMEAVSPGPSVGKLDSDRSKRSWCRRKRKSDRQQIQKTLKAYTKFKNQIIKKLTDSELDINKGLPLNKKKC